MKIEPEPVGAPAAPRSGVTALLPSLPPVPGMIRATTPSSTEKRPAAETPEFAECFEFEFQALESDTGHTAELRPAVTCAAEDTGEDAEPGGPEPTPSHDAGLNASAVLPVPVQIPVEARPPISFTAFVGEEAGCDQARRAEGAGGQASSPPAGAAQAEVLSRVPEEVNMQALRLHGRARIVHQADLVFALRLREKSEQGAPAGNPAVRLAAGSEPAAASSERVQPAEQSSALPRTAQPGTDTPPLNASTTPAAGPLREGSSGQSEASSETGKGQSVEAPRRAAKPQAAASEPERAPTEIRRMEFTAAREAKPIDAPRAVVEAPARDMDAPASLAAAPAPKAVLDVRAVDALIPEQKGAEPVRDLTLNVPVDADRTGVDQDVAVRFVERGGEVYVTVRTDDANLATRLRSDLNGLASSLDERGYQTESWRPAAASQSSAGDEQPADHRGRSFGDNARHEHTPGGEDRRHSRNRPNWLDALEKQEGEKA